MNVFTIIFAQDFQKGKHRLGKPAESEQFRMNGQIREQKFSRTADGILTSLSWQAGADLLKWVQYKGNGVF